MSDVLILGPQVRSPNLASRLAASGMTGPIAAITAGWQEREAELAALEEHLGQPVQDLRLYARAEAAFGADPEFHAAYRARQALLREMQDLYRLQLDACQGRRARGLRHAAGDTPPASGTRGRRGGAASPRCAAPRGDRRRARAVSRSQWRPDEHPALARHREELERTLASASTVLIAGGHVAVLINRLRLFGMQTLLRGKSLAAWSAGAMALSSRVLLFHDHPPQGAGAAEVFERGLGRVPDAVFLPHAVRRLALDDPERTALLARRLAPARCYTLDEGDWLLFRDGARCAGSGSRRLARSGPPIAIERAA